MKYSIVNIHAIVKHQKKVILLESKSNEKARHIYNVTRFLHSDKDQFTLIIINKTQPPTPKAMENWFSVLRKVRKKQMRDAIYFG